MRARWLLLSIVLVWLPACAEDGPPPDEPESALRLPDAFYGEWELTGTSGGLDGQGVPLPEGKPARIVLTRENTLERHAPDGKVGTERFTVRKGKTIFSSEDQWVIVYESGMMEVVVQLHPDGSLGLSENVYDGFSSTYRRVEK